MTPPLTPTERDLLTDQSAWCNCGDSYCSIRVRAERAILTIATARAEAAVEAFRAQVVAAIEAEGLSYCPGCGSCNGGVHYGHANAARIVAALKPAAPRP